MQTLGVVVALVGLCCLVVVASVLVVVARRHCRQAGTSKYRAGGLLRSLCPPGSDDVAPERQRSLQRSSGSAPDEAAVDLCQRDAIPLRSADIVDNSIYFYGSQTETSLSSKGD